MTIFRSRIFHTTASPFHQADALVALPDGALAVENGRIAACGDYATVAGAYPAAEVRDLRDGFILPGFIDTHVHFPQIRIIGGLGYSLLDWLRELALPEEASMADSVKASAVAREFTQALASHGTTTALVFGSHFAEATAALFSAAEAAGLRLFSGLVLSDRNLLPELHQTPDSAYRASRSLIDRFHGQGLLGYAVTPRFALSASAEMLDVASTLLKETPGLRFTTHINENGEEIAEVKRLFPRQKDYLGVYENHALTGPQAVLAHNVHPSNDELARIAASRTSIAHCAASNAALGSGIFPMRAHLNAGARFALGTDVGAGTSFSVMREALTSHLMQRVANDPVDVGPAQLLYLATRAGAEALDLAEETGDFSAGKSADFVYLAPAPGSVLAESLGNAASPHRQLASLFALAGPETIAEVRVADRVIFTGGRMQ